MASRALLAIFVGGKSRRMGTPKGLLRVSDGGETIVESLVRAGREAGLDVVLVGDAEAYAELAAGVPRIDDDPPGAGPLGGLRAAVAHAASTGIDTLIPVACDMPYVTAHVIDEVARATSGAVVVAPRLRADGPWEPMLARYHVGPLHGVLDEALGDGCRSFQSLFARLDVAALEPSPLLRGALRDWDSPDDVPR